MSEVENKQRSSNGHFRPGNTAGKGRPMGSRQRISEALLPLFGELLESEQARAALRTLLAEDAGRFFQIAAGLLPKQLEAMVTAQAIPGNLSPDEWQALRGVLDAIQEAGASGIEPAQCFALITHTLRAELAKPIEALPAPLPSLPPLPALTK